MKTKKILFLTGDLNNSGGTERVLALISNSLILHDYKIEIACIQCGDNPYFKINDEITIHSLYKTQGKVLFRLPALIFKLRNLIRKNKYDIVVTVETMGVLISIPSLLGMKIRHICWEHFNFNDNHGRKARGYARHLASKFCNDIVTLTERDKEFWQKGTKTKTKITAISNPLTFPPQISHNYPIDSKTILAVGRPIHKKGYDRLLEAWKKIHHLAPEWKLQIIGLDDNEQKKIEELSKIYEISSSINLIPPNKNIFSYYEKSAIYCLSSRVEGFPMVLLETLAFGIPVVSFNCETGPAEILKDTESVLVEDGDIDGFSNNLIKMINSTNLRIKISNQAKKKAESYSIDNITKKWTKLFNSKN